MKSSTALGSARSRMSLAMGDDNARLASGGRDLLVESMRTLMEPDESNEGLDCMEMDETDIQTLRNNILFKYMNPEKLRSLILDNVISLKKKKHKEILSKGLDCQDNIYIVKKGEIHVWIKLTQGNIQAHKEKMEKYHISHQEDYTEITKQKARYRRDALIDLISNKMTLNQERPSYINFSSTSDFNSANGATSRMNMPSTNRSTAMSRVNTACSSRIYNPPPSAAGNRPTTAYVKKTSMEELRTPYKASLARYHPPVHKKERIRCDLSESSLSSKNFAMQLRAVKKTNSAMPETATETTLKLAQQTDNCTELSEDISNNFDTNENDFPESIANSNTNDTPRTSTTYTGNIEPMQMRPITGKTKHLRINQDPSQIISAQSSYTERCSYIPCMEVLRNQIFGISDLIFNNRNVYKEDFKVEKVAKYSLNESEADEQLNSKNLNSYILICGSREVEYYVINKSQFINNMTSTEKFFFQSQIETMQKLCPQLPDNETIAGKYVQKQKWNSYKKKIYSDVLKSRSCVKFNAEKYRPKTAAVPPHYHTSQQQVSSDLTSTSKLTFTAQDIQQTGYRSSHMNGMSGMSGLSGLDLIRNSRANVKSDLYAHSYQKFNFHLSNEIVAQRRSAVHEAHAGKSRLRF